MGRQLTPRPPTLTLSPPKFHAADKQCSGKQCFRCCTARTSGSTSTSCSTSTPGSTSTSRRGGCAMGVAACGDQACSWSVVHSWQAIVAGPWPPVGGCALARPGMRTSPVSAARNLQTHWLSFCALSQLPSCARVLYNTLQERCPALSAGIQCMAAVQHSTITRLL